MRDWFRQRHDMLIAIVDLRKVEYLKRLICSVSVVDSMKISVYLKELVNIGGKFSLDFDIVGRGLNYCKKPSVLNGRELRACVHW